MSNRVKLAVTGALVVGLPVTVLLVLLWRVARPSHDPERKLTELRMQALMAALDRYALEHEGQLPTTHEGLRPVVPYLAEAAETVDTGGFWWSALPKDAWGQPFLYFSPGVHVGERFELMSLGADGQPGGLGEAEDVVSWGLR